MKLYELSATIAELQTMIDRGLVDADAAATTLEGLIPQARDRQENLAALIQNQEAEIAALKKAEEKIALRRKAIEKQRESWKAYLLDNMMRCGIDEISSPEWRVKLINNPPSVVVDCDTDDLPSDLVRTKVVCTPDKQAIKQAIESGELVEGCRIERGKRLRFD